MKYQHILAAVDLYEHEHSALTHAVELAKRYQAQLDITYVMPYVLNNQPYNVEFEQEVRKQSEQRLAAIVASLDFKNVKTHLLLGNSGSETTALAKKLGCDLIVAGSHGRHGFDLLLGSTANAILHHASCDVLTVRIDKNDHAVHQGQYRRVVLATDLNQDNQKVIDAAASVVQENQAELFVISVVPSTASMTSVYVPNIELEVKKLAEQKVQMLCTQLGIKTVNSKVIIGSPKYDILLFASQVKADLIVIGSHGRSGLSSLLLGSTANGVLHGAKTDVLVVRV